MKQLFVIAGGNGAGKTTFYNLFLKFKGLASINADEIAKRLDPIDPESLAYEAAEIGRKMVVDLIDEGASFCYETVFSHPSKIDYMARAKQNGYEVNLIYIHLVSRELNEARVQQRVQSGGHPVPTEKIYSRIPRAMNYIVEGIKISDKVFLFDNSSWEYPFILVVKIVKGNIEYLVDPLPNWAQRIMHSLS